MIIKDFKLFEKEMKELILSNHRDIISKVGVATSREDNDQIILNSIEKWSSSTELSGAVCIDNNKIVGFMLGEIKENPNKIWIKPYGLAASGANVDGIFYKLYKYCSKKWINSGYNEHVIESLNNDSFVQSLQNLGFAFQQVHGILKISSYVEQVSNAEIEVRQLNNNDEPLLRKMADIIYNYQNDSPVYAAPPFTINDIRNGYASLIDDKDLLFYIAETNEPVAFQGLWPEEEGYLVPDKCVELSIAGTFSNMSHQGIGSKLMNYVVDDLSKKGFEWIVADWRVTNISSRRFWNEKCGFKIVKHRMVRII
ncbi:GNAT family N-acetyltransferase [Mycoplasmatota bacterium WC44]